jgi:predicted PurR-regulated permease PerM
VPKTSSLPRWQRALILLSATVIGVTVIAALYWARSVLIPVALAVFFSFVLSPLVSALQRRHLGRTPSILIVVSFALLLFGALVWVVGWQMTRLAADLPNYSDNIKKKVVALKTGLGGGTVGQRFGQMTEEIISVFEGPGQPAPAEPDAERPTVVVQSKVPSWLSTVPYYLGLLVEFAAQGALAFVLVIFMLLKREDLRNRLIRLTSGGRITTTTRAVDDTAHRISRFLLTQLLINSCYGAVLAAGLWAIGLKHALLWGLLAAVLRYIPYLGTFLAALFPITVSIAMFDGWTQPVLTIGLILTVELLTFNVAEPLLYGKSIGISEVAQLVSAAFWAFLWGPIGLLLSGPLTVCLLVLGKYVPSLRVLDVLLGDEPALEEELRYYQRLAAKDQDEAVEVVLAHLKANSPERVYDDLLVPALSFARRDRHEDELTERDHEYILQATREVLEELSEQAETEKPTAPERSRVRVLACPATDESDQLALEMLRQLLPADRWEVRVANVSRLASEVLQIAEEFDPAVVCIGALPPGGLAHTRYLCKRLRSRFPNIKIVVGRWGLGGNGELLERQLKGAGADEVDMTLLETRRNLHVWHPVLAAETVVPAGGDRAGRAVAVS